MTDVEFGNTKKPQLLTSLFLYLSVRKQDIIKVTEQLIEAISNGDFENYTYVIHKHTSQSVVSVNLCVLCLSPQQTSHLPAVKASCLSKLLCPLSKPVLCIPLVKCVTPR